MKNNWKIVIDKMVKEITISDKVQNVSVKAFNWGEYVSIGWEEEIDYFIEEFHIDGLPVLAEMIMEIHKILKEDEK
jgi:hypothetical protein